MTQSLKLFNLTFLSYIKDAFRNSVSPVYKFFHPLYDFIPDEPSDFFKYEMKREAFSYERKWLSKRCRR